MIDINMRRVKSKLNDSEIDFIADTYRDAIRCGIHPDYKSLSGHISERIGFGMDSVYVAKMYDSLSELEKISLLDWIKSIDRS
jgi:hypothetical protein